jgi:D-alanine--poly(phosphoribitol) ligase subunit 2
MKEKIIEIIIKLTGYEELKENENIDLIENDILDSLSFIELIAELEEEFNIEIQPTQIPSDVWISIDNINKMVNEKLERNGK